MRLLLILALTLPVAAQTVDPHGKADLITQVNALAQACNFNCTIHIPAGDYTVASGTILLHHNGLSLVGDGRNNTIIHYAGLNFLDSRLDAATYNPSFFGGGLVSGFTLNCTNPQVKCITGGSVLGQRWEDLTIDGPGGPVAAPPPGSHAEGFVFQNTFAWMERTIFRDIFIGGFNTNFHFKAAVPPGTDSFGYSLFDAIFTTQGRGTRAFVVDPGANLYNVLGFSMQFDSQGTTAEDEVFAIGGTFTGVGFHVTGEQFAAPLTFAHIACAGRMTFAGDYNIFGGSIFADCPQSKDLNFTPFHVGTLTGLAGIAGSFGGNPTIAASTSLGQTPPQTLLLYPSQAFHTENPYQNAITGFVTNPAGLASPIGIYDPRVPWCLATRLEYHQPGDIAYRLCLSGSGDLTTTGTLTGTTLQTTRPTPASSHETCTPGESWDDDNFHYHCTSTKQIKRLSLQPF